MSRERQGGLEDYFTVCFKVCRHLLTHLVALTLLAVPGKVLAESATPPITPEGSQPAAVTTPEVAAETPGSPAIEPPTPRCHPCCPDSHRYALTATDGACRHRGSRSCSGWYPSATPDKHRSHCGEPRSSPNSTAGSRSGENSQSPDSLSVGCPRSNDHGAICRWQ
ncbi:hypothetical protein [Neosynechococcus sphagnicola]|uniref:hypothetical protein n=1 Tax=Neosynechococcus sphagnicola TaxID=1501145 RepID=UPI0012E081CC|nr:hypothetical protein [Neosynechococcus sphagnicola]